MRRFHHLLFITALLSTALAAEDGAAVFKAKCVGCHGVTGAGKPAIKGSNLLTEDAKKRTDQQLAAAIAKGGEAGRASHAYEKKGVTSEQVDLLVKHVRALQKQAK